MFIAYRNNVAPHTLKTYLTKIFKKEVITFFTNCLAIVNTIVIIIARIFLSTIDGFDNTFQGYKKDNTIIIGLTHIFINKSETCGSMFINPSAPTPTIAAIFRHF